MKAFLAILLLVSGFWAGHVYSSFHVTNELLPSLQRSQSLHLASLMLRSVELLDKGEVVDLRTKLIGLARSEVEPPPSVPTNWRAMLGSPFHGRGVLDDMKVKNESSAAELKRRLELLDELQANQGAERARYQHAGSDSQRRSAVARGTAWALCRMKKGSYTCPCCGYLTFREWPGSYEICRVCFWEDDPVQVLDPWFEGGANKPSLIQAQANFAEFGAMEKRFIENVKGIRSADVRDPEWRRVAEYDRSFARAPRDLTESEHGDLSVWYYWKRHAA